MNKDSHIATPHTLDPSDWQELRTQGHRMLDDMLDYLEHLRERPVWQPIPQPVRDRFHEPLPAQPADLATVHASFMHDVLPYAVGKAHPGFMGWGHGGGTPVGMLAEMLAAGLNANLGGRDQMPIEMERQVLQWMRELFGFPDSSSGLFTKYFLKGMSGEADAKPYGNGDGKVGYDELGRYFKETLTYFARRYYGREQTAQIVIGR